MSVNATEASAISSFLQAPEESLGNAESVEYYWAVKAHQHAETYVNLIKAADTKNLTLTKVDDELYEMMGKIFPDLNVEIVDEDVLKSDDNKKIWNEEITKFKERVTDWDVGSLLRRDCRRGFAEDNTILVPRVQFLAIEVVRNRRGFNVDIQD